MTSFTLSTAEGPAFKPLPVAVTAVLTPLGGLAPEAWVVIARAGAVLAVLLAFVIARRLAGGSIAAGAIAAVAVALCGGFPGLAAAGAETGWTLAFALLGWEAWRTGRARAALACAVGCALLRVEAWPFVLALGILLWRRRPQDRALLVACAVAVPALWFVPEWLGSGDALRSGSRARMPNPGQPALADVPALASLKEAAQVLLWPLWAGVAACLFLPAARAARLPLAAGAAWVAIVAIMAQAGFSGEPRYAIPGMALIAIAAAVGLTRFGDLWVTRTRRSPHLATAAIAAAIIVAAAPRVADLPDLRSSQAYQRGLATDLERLIADAGRNELLACGRPYVGDLRGPLLAYHLDVEKRRVAFVPAPPGVVFRSRLHEDAEAEPAAGPAFAAVTRDGRWEVLSTCGVRGP